MLKQCWSTASGGRGHPCTCQRKWIIGCHFFVHPGNSTAVCSVPAAVKITVYHNDVSGPWLPFCSLLAQGLASFCCIAHLSRSSL